MPTGWALCDGNNGTPNLVDRFIVGAGSTYDVGATGGSNTVTLTTNQIPSHTHTFTGTSHTHTTTSSGGGSVTVTCCTGSSSGTTQLCGTANSSSYYDRTLKLGGDVTVNSTTAGGTNSNTGGGQAHENRPPYYALCYIMKL